MRLKQVILALFIVRFCVNISLSLLRFGIMMVREKNCYYAIALTDFFVFLSCAERFYILYDGFKNSNFSIPAELGLSVKKLRYLPNRRINLLSIDEQSRLFANMVSQDIDLT